MRASSSLQAIPLISSLPLSHARSHTLELGSRRLHLEKRCTEATHSWLTYRCLSEFISTVNAACSSSETCSSSAWAVRAKMASPKWQLWTHCLAPFHEIKFFLLFSVFFCSFEQQNRLQSSQRTRNGKSHRCALEIHLRCADRERHLLRLFLKPSTILYTHVSAGAKGVVCSCCHLPGIFLRGLSEKITQLEVLISFFLWYLFW